jgi:transposase
MVVGATAVIQHIRRGGCGSPWITDLLKRKSPKLAAVALANKMARIAWKMMVSGHVYRIQTMRSTSAKMAWGNQPGTGSKITAAVLH